MVCLLTLVPEHDRTLGLMQRKPLHRYSELDKFTCVGLYKYAALMYKLVDFQSMVFFDQKFDVLIFLFDLEG